MKTRLLFIALLLCSCMLSTASEPETGIIGHVKSGGQYLPFINISLKGTTIGILTDESGHYQLVHLPEGSYTVVASSMGYKSQERSVMLDAGRTVEVEFDLESDALRLNEVVVSGDRSQQLRYEAPVMVNTVSPKLFESTQSATLGEGISFSPGMRVEYNCQNCGFTQVRMNGMEGPYSQILINSRPIFSGLAGVYGLELIPSNMLERVEIVRGGGSALYGGNAIAGTINLILKEPQVNSYEAGLTTGLSGVGMDGVDAAPEYAVNINTSVVSDDRRTGLSLYGFARDKEMFDANGDGFSEISPQKNLSLGSRVHHKLGARSQMAVDLLKIHESRAGGNRYEVPYHARDIAEAVEHDLNIGALTYERYFRQYDMLSVYGSVQDLTRDSYYGANRSLADYGSTTDLTYNIGTQYKYHFEHSSIIVGTDLISEHLVDKKLGYADYDNAVIVDGAIAEVPYTDNTTVSDQVSQTTGAFAQYDIRFERFRLAVGGRADHYRIRDHQGANADKTGTVFIPRVNLMYNITDYLQARAGYSQGYRAPQVFDEDLHIETSGSRMVINVNDPKLSQESSHSYMFSLDFNRLIGTVYTGFLAEAFYTRLDHPFVNEIGTPDEHGTVHYTRVNADGGASVQGVNMELKLKPLRMLELSSGMTVQTSHYDEAQEFGEKRFFRTPDLYGFFAADWDFAKSFCLSATGTYTGEMLVPYFGPNTDPEAGELRVSDRFYDLGMKLEYTKRTDGADISLFGGVKNIFNSFQSDHDTGIDRDPAYMYGPGLPRTVYVGVKVGNLL